MESIHSIFEERKAPRVSGQDCVILIIPSTRAECYSVGGTHLSCSTSHVAIPAGSSPAAKGDPCTCVKAPLLASMAYAETLLE